MDSRAIGSSVIQASQYRRERWRNQLGWTREILRHGPADDWDWRLSIAEIERDAAFSPFPGVDRELVLLSGNGVRLRFDDGEAVTLQRPYERHRFSGECGVTGELLDGPTQDFNLMWRRDRVETESWHRPLVGPMVIFGEPGTTWIVHVLAGDARFAADSGLAPMQTADTAILAASEARVRYVLEGAGEILVMRISPRSPPQ
ncbi:HutD/Ves family protein [Lysobacter sp. A378]